MTLCQFHDRWHELYLVDDLELKDQSLTSLFRECQGGHRGGLLFISREEESWVLKCDENDVCYRRVKETGDEEEDWSRIGSLVNPIKQMPPLI